MNSDWSVMLLLNTKAKFPAVALDKSCYADLQLKISQSTVVGGLSSLASIYDWLSYTENPRIGKDHIWKQDMVYDNCCNNSWIKWVILHQIYATGGKKEFKPTNHYSLNKVISCSMT